MNSHIAVRNTLPAPYFQDDAVTIYLGDCRELLPLMPKVDLVLTDPPYGIGYASNQLGPMKGEALLGDDDTRLWDWTVKTFSDQQAVIFGHWRRPPENARGAVVWDKGDGVGMGDLAFPWRPNFEMAYIFGDGWEGHRDSSIVKDVMVSWASKGRKHPTQKPIGLIRHFISKAPHANLILDPFMGSGTTLRAAKDLGRKAIGIEIEERYCEVAARRMAQGVLL